MRLRKALVCASCAPSQAAQQLYFCAGASAGVAEGLTAEARHGYCCVLERLECRAARAEGRLRGACAESVGRLYYAAGALAGLYQGTRRAAHEAWVDWREDEVRARLIRGSPVKYGAVDFRLLSGSRVASYASVLSDVHI